MYVLNQINVYPSEFVSSGTGPGRSVVFGVVANVVVGLVVGLVVGRVVASAIVFVFRGAPDDANGVPRGVVYVVHDAPIVGAGVVLGGRCTVVGGCDYVLFEPRLEVGEQDRDKQHAGGRRGR